MNQGVDIHSIEQIKSKLSQIQDRGKKVRTTRFIISALSNIPWVGGFLGAGSALHAETEQHKVNYLQKLWIEEHQRKIEELSHTIFQIIDKLESAERSVQNRLGSEEYMTLVRKGFKVWDEAETFEKKEYIRTLLTNAATTSLSTDDMVRLFLDWINNYHETHFMIIKEIYQHKSITRGQIWKNISKVQPAENSIEADLYRLLIRDLSTGGIIRQQRETDYEGNFLKKPTKNPKTTPYKSAFDDSELYGLTELGQRFVRYTMEDVLTEDNL